MTAEQNNRWRGCKIGKAGRGVAAVAGRVTETGAARLRRGDMDLQAREGITIAIGMATTTQRIKVSLARLVYRWGSTPGPATHTVRP